MQNTSLQAYTNMLPKIKTDHEKILSVLSKKQPLTYNEISKLLKWHQPVKVARRLPELLRLGLIKKSEQRKCSIAKSNCNTYIKL